MMMGKLIVDSVLTWAKQYKVDGFRFDLMGFQPKRTSCDSCGQARTPSPSPATAWTASRSTSTARAGTSARSPTTRCSSQASQLNMAGTGIGTFNDRIRDAVRGGGPFDANPRIQGFASGLYTDPNGDTINGDAAAQKARLLLTTRT